VPLLSALTLALTPAAPQEDAAPHRFLESERCAMCHSASEAAEALRDEAGRSVAPYDLWRGSMMANASRDPLWRAMVSAEQAARPAAAAAIEQECSACHAPMAAEDRDGPLGLDGVSCTVCHQITPEGLGTEASYSGGFVLGPGDRIFGPYEDPFTRPMRMHTGYTPTPSGHVREAALCATCHTLFTEALDAEGRPTGHRLPEQTPYLEWRNSIYSTEDEAPGGATCQECHMPATDEDGAPIRTRIARNPGGRDFPPIGEREPFRRHLFVGGNAVVPEILRDHAEEFGVAAPAEALTAVAAAAREQLATRTARLDLVRGGRAGDRLVLELRATNLTGHKLPTGHPLRRVWIALRVTDAEGRLIFASGRTDPRGRIVGADGTPLPQELRGGPLHPHRGVVRSSDEVQVWESVMEDAGGAPTWSLLSGARYAKDDRLLPRGWRADGPDAEITRPVGPEDDADFRGGSDTVRFEIAAPAARGPFRVEAELLHQVAGARYLAELLAAGTPETERLGEVWFEQPRPPEVMASVSYRVE
jgi:hypothetical protein